MENAGPHADGMGLRSKRPLDAVRLRPTPQGAVYLWTISLFSLAMLVLDENLVFLLGTLVLGSGVVAWWLARRNLRGLLVARELPRRTRAGLPTPLTWQVVNPRRRAAVGIEIEDRPTRGMKPVCLQAEFPVVPGGGTAEVTTQVTFGRRGVFQLGRGETWAWSRYPLGLYRAAAPGAVDGQILVRPAEGRVTNRLRAMLRGHRDSEARRRRVWRGDDVIYGVREFRDGDDPRRIHWRSTARRGALIVSEWRAEQGREAVIVLGRSPGAGRRSAGAFERAVSCAATLWRACSRESIKAQLVVGRGAGVTMGENGRGLDKGLDLLATVAPQRGRRPRAAVHRLRKSGKPCTVIYVASGAEPGLEKDLSAAAGRGGSSLALRSDLRSIRGWIRGLA